MSSKTAPRSSLYVALTTTLTGCYAGPPLDEPPPATIEGRYVVGLPEGFDAAALADDLRADGLALEHALPRAGLARVADPDLRDADDVLAGLASYGGVVFAEPEVRYTPSYVPDDYDDYLWAFDNGGAQGGTRGADIGAFEAWDRSRGAGVVVAVIDTGVWLEHPDLRDGIWTNPGEIPGNGRDDDGNGYVDDVHGWDFVHDGPDVRDREGHGTHVAGIVGARAGDGYGVPGTAFEATILPVKLLDPDGGGGSYAAAAAIRYAVDQGAQVINASWGSYGYSSALRQAIDHARQRGVLFVAAAGNEGRDNDRTPLYPASHDLPNVVSVAASDRRDRIAEFSNVGAQRVHLAAPGVDIVSTWTEDQLWMWLDGTSMAAPFVSGTAALLRSARPELTPEALRDVLLSTAAPLAAGAGSVASGGRLDAAAALAAVLGAPDGGDGTDPATDDPEPDAPAPPSDGAWNPVPFPVQSAHPYADDYHGSVGVEAPVGAASIRLRFVRIDVEAGYDFVEIRSEAGAVLRRFTGRHDAFTTEPIGLDAVEVHLVTDGSVTGWGLQLEGFDWR